MMYELQPPNPPALVLAPLWPVETGVRRTVDHPRAEDRIIYPRGYGRADECTGLENQRW
jgi:hypothetical protein